MLALRCDGGRRLLLPCMRLLWGTYATGHCVPLQGLRPLVGILIRIVQPGIHILGKRLARSYTGGAQCSRGGRLEGDDAVSETIGVGPGIGGVPVRQASGGSTSSVTTSTPGPIPSGAAGPVWQPWVDTHAKAQSVLKTQINTALVAFNRDMADAQRLLDAAESIAQQQVKQLEAAAWAAWHKYMQEANTVHEAVMTSAIAAYDSATTQAYDRANTLVFHAQAAYDRAKDISVYGRNLATGSDTF